MFVAPENPRPVRAKMYVEGITYRSWGTVIRLQAVTRGEDNKEWSAATPNGHLEMTVKNDDAADQFAPGQEWYVDLRPIPPKVADQEGMDLDAEATG